ncbi:hypothetical protein DERP_015441, partial [Dermatophagoides pteronyssinus]
CKAMPDEFDCIKNLVWYSNHDKNTLDFVQELARERQQRIAEEKPRQIVQQNAFLTNKRNVKCFQCGLEGHVMRMCPKNEERPKVLLQGGGIGHRAMICPNDVNASHPPLKEMYDLMHRISADLMDIKDHLGEIENHSGYRYVLHLVEHHSSFGGVYFL